MKLCDSAVKRLAKHSVMYCAIKNFGQSKLLVYNSLMIATYFNSLSAHIVSSIPNCVRHVGYGRELNSYPAISILRPDSADYQSNIRHLADGSKLYIIRCMVRGYSHSDIDDSQSACEELARSIESAVQSYNHQYLLDDARVLSVETDEGLYAPYGICDLEVEMALVSA